MVPFYIIFFSFSFPLSLSQYLSLSPEESKGVKDFGSGVKKREEKARKYNRTGVRWDLFEGNQ
jgi:hypothetical protein